VKLEMLHNARNPAEFRQIEDMMDRMLTLRITTTASLAAVAALRKLVDMATPGDPWPHRVKAGDALVAAIAAEHGFGVLHYDHDFDRLARALNFDSIWIATAGSF
jgi:predicted nucleic acid-binding protein